MRRILLGAAAAIAAAGMAGSAFADPHKNESRGGRGGYEYKEEYRDGPCKIERKVSRNGDYKEEVKCKGRRGSGVVHYRPDVVIVDPVRSHDVLVPSSGMMLQCNRDLVGGLIGAGVGGLAGSQVGRGNGQLAATAAGTVLGFLVGGEIGRTMDRVDQACAAQALERLGPNQIATWQSANGQMYQVRPTTVIAERAGRLCREFSTTAIIGGRPEELVGTACRQGDGSWKVI